jgi:hypothetical protein
MTRGKGEDVVRMKPGSRVTGNHSVARSELRSSAQRDSASLCWRIKLDKTQDNSNKIADYYLNETTRQRLTQYLRQQQRLERKGRVRCQKENRLDGRCAGGQLGGPPKSLLNCLLGMLPLDNDFILLPLKMPPHRKLYIQSSKAFVTSF